MNKIAGYVICKYDLSINEKEYLAWQFPVWNEDGYFWTSYKILINCLRTGLNNKKYNHTFIFTSRGEALKLLKYIKKEDYKASIGIQLEHINIEY